MDDEERVDPYFLLITPYDGMDTLSLRGKQWVMRDAFAGICDAAWCEAAEDFMDETRVGGSVRLKRNDGANLTLIRTR